MEDRINLNVGEQIKFCLLGQFHDTWDLLFYHLRTLSNEECFWRPGSQGPHIFQDESGQWRGDWPVGEHYDTGPASIGWISWHINMWWSMLLNHSFGDQSLQIKDVTWPDDANALRTRLLQLRNEWVDSLQKLEEKELMATTRSRWPWQNKQFSGIIGWANMELMKNAAEVGYIRYLYSQREKNLT